MDSFDLANADNMTMQNAYKKLSEAYGMNNAKYTSRRLGIKELEETLNKLESENLSLKKMNSNLIKENKELKRRLREETEDLNNT